MEELMEVVMKKVLKDDKEIKKLLEKDVRKVILDHLKSPAFKKLLRKQIESGVADVFDDTMSNDDLWYDVYEIISKEISNSALKALKEAMRGIGGTVMIESLKQFVSKLEPPKPKPKLEPKKKKKAGKKTR